ncbi:MAG: FAD-binding protein [Prevotellaceae bacterium]|nr:FAD-binding protein [Prevotellaceae bacterium]
MVREIQLRLQPCDAYNEQTIRRIVAQEQAIDERTITCVRMLRRSIDARQRNIFVNLTLKVFVNEQPDEPLFQQIVYKDVSQSPAVIVVGMGPGGLFAALRLIELGLKPVIVERGKDVRERKKDIAEIRPQQKINPESNYAFGEGGAGAYSDGKLYTRSKKRGSCEKILGVLCQHGASPAILSDAHPHIGTDKLPAVIENIRNTILSCGGEVHFETKMTGLLLQGDKLVGIVCGDRSFRAQAVILATGHSARDTYQLLLASGVEMEAKGLAVGVRLEHPAQLIDQLQYHSRQGRGKYLPAAEYNFVRQVGGRGVYSFCMCPGGSVVPAATAPQQIVVNGMSPSSRVGQWSNSGMVVELRPEDVEGDDLLRMMRYQERLENDCWLQGNRKQTAPAQRMSDFVNSRLSYDLPRSSYAPGLISSPLHFWMPQPIVKRLQEGFNLFGQQKHGFLTNEAVVIGVETRTSSPLRILRSAETFQHIRVCGLFPCGEGAGYAGGIVSSAIDGERCAEAASAFLAS